MRKFDFLKSFTQGVKGFVAMLLVTVLAVGNVFADEVTYVFSQGGFTNAQDLGSGSINDVISYTTAQNSASGTPKYYTSGTAARFYGGNGNGNSMTLIPEAGYTITGLEITATSSYAPVINYIVDEGATATVSATSNVYTISGIDAVTSLQFINAATGTSQLRITQIKVTYTQGAGPAVATPTFSVAAGSYYDAFTVSLATRTNGAAIYYTTDGTTPTTASALYTEPIAVNATTTINAIAVNGENMSSVATATYAFPVEVANIAAFKATAQSNVVYKITGDVTYVFRNGRYMFVQDATGGLLIYDYATPNISTTYTEGDVISGGIYGTVTVYNGLTELVPTRNTAAATANNGAIVPTVVTAANLIENYGTLESKLVKIVGATFTSNTAFYQAGDDDMAIYNRFNTVNSTRNAGDVADVIGFASKYNTNIQLFPRDNYDLIPAVVNLPYTENFDGRTNSWTLNNGTATNKWYIGQAQGFDNAKLFISNNGSTNKYANVASTATASVDVNIPAAGAIISFDYRVNGEANKDYLKVELTNGDNTLELAKLSGSNDWSAATYDVAPAFAGTCTLAFTWVNDGGTANQFPAAIDNVTILAAPCAQPTALNATVTGTTANITWTPGAGQTAWIFEYKLADNQEWYTVNATTASVTLNDLQGNSVYDMRVRANCGDNQSPWIYGTFAVECQSLVTSVADQIVGTGSSSSYFSPFNNYYKNSWNQCIYTADEVGSAGNIYAIAWNCVNAASMTFTDVKIYMGTTTHSAHTSTSDWVPESELTLVYSADAPTVGASTGWENYNLQTPFYYNGTDNLVVVVAKKAGSYSSSLKYAYTDKTNRCLYRQNDGSTEYAYHPGSNTGTLGGYLANIKLHMDASICGDAIQCPAPTDVVVSNVTTTTADVAWTAGADENAWVVEYKTAEETAWNMADATATNYTLTNLTPNADYMVRVKAVCGDNNHSNLAVANFTTIANCVVPSNIASRNNANNTMVYWTANNNETAWTFEYKLAGETAWNTIDVANEPIVTLSNLDNMSAYDVRVKANCSETESSEWVAYQFTSGCAAYEIPYEEGFETSELNSVPGCWTMINNHAYNSSAYPMAYVNNSTSYVHSGSKSLYLRSSNAEPLYAVMPLFNANNVTVSFYYRNEGTSASNGTLVLGTMTDPTDASTFTAIRTLDRVTTLTQVSENILGLNGRYIAFKYENGTAQNYYLGIDDINVTLISECVTPTSVASANVTTTTADLTWNAGNEEHAWQVEYGVAGFTQGTGTIVNATATELTLTNLTANTTYDVYVRAKCGNNDYSEWSSAYTFTTVACDDADKCTFTINMVDSYGDGWNGASLDVLVNGELVGNYTVGTSSNTATVAICDNQAFSLAWHNGSYDGECSYSVVKDGETVYSGAGAQSGTFFTQNGCQVGGGSDEPDDPTPSECVKDLPYVENFESYTASTSISSFSTTPDCWNIIYSGTSTGYKPHVYSGSSYNPTGSKTLIFTSGTSSYGNNAYAILPAFTTDLNSTEVSFKYRMESTTYGTLYLGYVTNADDGNSFVVLETMVSKTTGTQFETSLVGRNIPAGARLAFRWTHTSSYYSCAIDDIEVLQAATCQKPSITSVVATTNTATVTIGASATPAIGYEVVYGTPGFDVESATPVAVDANNTVVLTGLQHSTGYVVYARAICSDEDMSYWSNAYAFQTECGPASLPYTENFDGVVSTTTISTSVFPACWSSYFSGTSTSYGNSVYASSTYARSGVNTLRLYNYQTTSTSASYGTAIAMLPEIEGDLDVMGMTFYARRSSTSATYSGFFDVGVVTDPSDPEGSFVPVQQHMIPANDVYQQMTVSFANYTGAPGRIAFRALKDYTESNTTSNYAYVNIYVDDITVEQVVFNKDIELVDVEPIYDACDLSNARVKITVNNRNSSGSISSFTASYSVNGGAAVTETVTPATPIAMGETYTYTFAQAPALTEEVNNIEVVVSYPGDGNVNNNVMTLGPIHLITPLDVPYFEDFSNVVMGRDGWGCISSNYNNVNWIINNGTPTYTFNDTMDAGSSMLSPCINIPAGLYQISYDYNALDVLNENLNVYIAPVIEDPTTWVLIGQHSNITHTAEATTARYNFNNEQAGVYYIIIEAASRMANMGITFDNLSIAKLYDVNITTGNNGTATPNGNVYVAEGNDLNITVLPDAGYHVASITVNGEEVAEEDENQGNAYNYTLAEVTANTNVNITFAPSSYIVVKTVNPATPYGHFVPATNDVVAYGQSDNIKVVADAHYHLSHLMISNVENVAGTDVIEDVVANGNTYNYTFNVYTNKYVNAIFRIDTVGIHYNVLAGNGVVDIYTVDGNTTYPANFTHYVDYGSNYDVVFTPAPGYHVANVTLNGVAQGEIAGWNFVNLDGEQYFTVEFEKDVYTITTTAYGNGTVSAGETFAYDPEHEYVFEATPAVGHHIASLTRNQVAVNVAAPEVGYTETLTNILSSYDYVAIFEPNTYFITATAGNNGAITPAAATGYAYGENATYTITADLGYYIASVTVDGETTNYTQADNMTTTTVNFNNITEAHTISATFATYQYTITVNAATNGTITPGTSTYAYGTTPTFSINPAAGYGVADVMVDGESVGATTAYTFPSLTANHTIEATFAQYRYTITATAGNNGTITPAGVTPMIAGGNQAYTIAPATGYHVADVFVDGASVGAVTSYNFTNVNGNHSIYAEFAANEYTVTVNQPANGTITPGTMTVAYGATPTFVITPNTGYAVTAITGVANINNVPSNNGVYTYTMPAVTGDVTLSATMTLKTFTITATAGSHGTVTPAGASTVNYGANKTYTITPAAGYVIDNVTVDGMTVGAVSSYIFTNVAANHTINATFRMEDCNVPTNMQTINIDRNSATLVWYHPTATSFEIQYKAQDDATYTLVTVNNANSYDLSLLNAGTAYVWKVRALCSANNYSDWSNAVSFRTVDEPVVPGVGIEDHNADVNVYASHNNVYIVNNNGVQINNVQIFDIYGKLVYSGNVNSTTEVISMNVANGNYVVRLSTEQGMSNYKVYLTK